MATDVPIGRTTSRYESLPNAGLALAGAAATAGVIHIVAMIEHVGEDWDLGLFFFLVGAAQVAAGWSIFKRPEDMPILKLVAIGSLAVGLLWLFSRTTGLPFGPESGRRKVGVGDTVATGLEFGFAAIVGLLLWRGERAMGWLNSAIGVRLTCAVLSLSLMLAAVGGHQH